jgi:hypothetical protein
MPNRETSPNYTGILFSIDTYKFRCYKLDTNQDDKDHKKAETRQGIFMQHAEYITYMIDEFIGRLPLREGNPRAPYTPSLGKAAVHSKDLEDALVQKCLDDSDHAYMASLMVCAEEKELFGMDDNGRLRFVPSKFDTFFRKHKL